MKPNLNKKRKQQVREWLKTRYKSARCPFVCKDKDGSHRTACRVCKRLFPEERMRLIKDRLTGYFIADACPCDFLTVKEVTKRAREWVK